MIDATKLDQMLEALRDAEDDKEMRKAAQSVLAEDPEHPEARLALWELMEEEEALEELGRLEAILEETKRRIGGAPSGLYDEHPLTETYGALLMHLAFGFHAKEDLERALDYARTLVAFDDQETFWGRAILYRCLLDLQRYDRILEVLETDPLETPVGEHARAIALFETQGACEESLEALLNALSLDPNLPFLILGLMVLPEEDEAEDLDPSVLETLQQSQYLEVPWMETEERANFLTLPTLILGSLTNRLEEDALEVLEESLAESPLKAPVAALRAQAAQRDPDEDQEERDQWALEELMKLLLGEE